MSEIYRCVNQFRQLLVFPKRNIIIERDAFNGYSSERRSEQFVKRTWGRAGSALYGSRPHRHHARPAGIGPDAGGRSLRRHPCRAQLDRLARSVPEARQIADGLVELGVKLALGTSIYDPADPMGKMFFNILATFAGFEVDLIRMCTREGMAIARAKGKLRGKQPKFSGKQQKERCRMHDTGEYSISDLAELFSVSRPTVYRTLARKVPQS